MIDLFPTNMARLNASSQWRRALVGDTLAALMLLGISALVGLLAYELGPSPLLLVIPLALVALAAVLYRPRSGVYLLLALTLAGDNALTPWYPFTKNLSSHESLLFIHDALIVSPLELMIVFTYLAWLVPALLRRRLAWYGGPLLGPLLAFIGCMSFGLGYGLARGGDLNVALWEARGIFYLPALLVLVSNLITRRAHVNALLWAMVVGITINSLSGVWYVAAVLNFNIGSVERIAEHASSVQANAFFVLLLVAWIYRGTWAQRLLLPGLLPLVLLSYLANQRRAAFVALAVALLVLVPLIYHQHRRLFWRVVPLALLLVCGYLAAFWNSSGALGQPARAVRTVVAPDTLSSRDVSSNTYRELENINVMYTLRQAPLLGIGFGQKFSILVPMADISSFVWWEYMTHNSVLWIWIKAGIGGFVSMLFLFGVALRTGMRTILRLPGDHLNVAAITATLYVLMHFVFAYVDISWDLRSMVLVGAMLGLINCLEQVALKHDPQPRDARQEI